MWMSLSFGNLTYVSHVSALLLIPHCMVVMDINFDIWISSQIKNFRTFDSDFQFQIDVGLFFILFVFCLFVCLYKFIDGWNRMKIEAKLETVFKLKWRVFLTFTIVHSFDIIDLVIFHSYAWKNYHFELILMFGIQTLNRTINLKQMRWAILRNDKYFCQQNRIKDLKKFYPNCAPNI